MWAILNTLSGNQEVEEVVVDNAANWTPLRGNGMMGNPNVENQMNNGPHPAIKVRVQRRLKAIQDANPFLLQSEANSGPEMDSKQFSNKVMSPGSTTLPTWDNSQAMSPYMMCPDMSSIASGSMMNK